MNRHNIYKASSYSKTMRKKRCNVDKARAISPRINLTKKGQVTIFIILGILLVLVTILYIAFQTEIVTLKPSDIIPTQKGKVETFISTCIEEVGDQALFLVGLQGGFIEVPSETKADGSSHLKLSQDNVVPYWAQGPVTFIPSLTEIKSRIDDYVEKNVRDCLVNTKAFQESYNLLEKSDITADTVLGSNNVLFNLIWNIEVRNKDGEVVAELIDHSAESPVHFKNVHDLALQIVTQEMQTLKLEDLTQDLISLEAPNVPVAGIEVSCSKKKWKVGEVKSALKELLRINIGQLKVSGTEFVEFPDELPYYKNHYIWDVGEVPTDVSANFQFEETYPFQFQVTPSDGVSLKSDQLGGTSLLSALCIQSWKFTYDVTYPVLIKVRDETTGYNFNVAMTVHLIRNIPNRNVPLQARPSSSLGFIDDEAFCQKRRIPMTVITNELVENNYGVYFTEPLDDVDISYTCLKYQCDYDKTDLNFVERGYQSGFTTNFPYCVGAIMRGEKDGYKEDWKRVVTQSGETVELNLVPLYDVPLSKIKIIQHEVRDDAVLPGIAIDEDLTGSIRIAFSKPGSLTQNSQIPPSLRQPYHESRVGISKNIDPLFNESEKLSFLAKADFTYEVDIQLLDGETFVGGYKANWTADWSDLENVEEITFHTVSKKNPSNEDSFGLLLRLGELSANVPKPEIK